MQFVVLCYDATNKLDDRMATRPAHLEFLADHNTTVKMAGPMLSDDGQTPIGSSLIVEADSIEDVHDFCDQDPYFLKGVFEKRIVHPLRVVINEMGDA